MSINPDTPKLLVLHLLMLNPDCFNSSQFHLLALRTRSIPRFQLGQFRFVCSIKFILVAFKLAGGKSTRDRRANVARGAAPCSERSDAKQLGLSIIRAVSSAGRTYSRQESIEVCPLFQRDSSGSRSLDAFFKCLCALILLFYLILRLFEHDAVSLRDFQ